MRNNETGEFELVMGNRQLLSGFFIVCLLFGVAFAMGYIVGRNSSPATHPVADMGIPSPAPVVQDSRPAASGALTPPAQPAADTSTASGAAPSDSTATAVAPNLGQPAATQPAPAAPAATAPPAAAPAPPPQTTASAPATAASSHEPPAGAYWQVMALKAPDAEIVMRSLKDKGFPVFTEPGANNLRRVLVGPYSDRAALGKAKAELENAGFHPYLHKK
jgi:cell division septation protein DedD